ncbi:MAG TPA: DUF1990 domain-containing protein [Vicinamibacterales bacterium]
MFLLHRPSAQDVERFIAGSRELSLSYEPVGLARAGRAGFALDEQIAIVGSGEAAFARATTALIEWRHFELGWVELFPKRPPIAPGAVVVVSVRHLGFWSLNGCRVVYSIGARGDSTFGFAYGTLTNHAESGEEIFQVSFRPETGEVSYRIRAVSRPRAALARLGYPLTRSLQARFRRDSARALRSAILEPL